MADLQDSLVESSKPEEVERKGTKAVVAEIPDGGFTAWLQCGGSFFLFFNCWGVVNTFGVFQTFYEQSLLVHESSSNISWIGTIQAFLLIFIGLITGPLFDYGYLRGLIITGSFGIVFGMMMTSICTEYWQVLLAQGILVGLGCGCLFVPSIAIIPQYFSTKKAFAQGIGASGSSLGGVIYPIMFHKLEPRIGFGWTTRAIAFVVALTMVIPLVGMKMRAKPSVHRRLFDITAWREAPFTFFGIAEFFGFMGLYIPFFYISVFAIDNHIVGKDLAFYLLALLNAGSFFGRIIPNYIADRIGPMNVLILCTFTAAVLAFVWIKIHTLAGIVIFALLYGFFSGTFVSIPPTVIVTLSPSMGVVGVRSGMLFVPISFGLLIGNPIAGAILKRGWLGLEAFCGVLLIISGIIIVAARVSHVGWRLTLKA